eukprot:Tamp_39092.p1 GENE.Tamp_39092~~Tamp_39092.p1  ORF type:complete len:124 (-),score=1.38 Tamp_39092:4-375(-)
MCVYMRVPCRLLALLCTHTHTHWHTHTHTHTYTYTHTHTHIPACSRKGAQLGCVVNVQSVCQLDEQTPPQDGGAAIQTSDRSYFVCVCVYTMFFLARMCSWTAAIHTPDRARKFAHIHAHVHT